MSVLTKDQILAADDLKTETVEVPEWGGEVMLRTLTGAQRDEYESQTIIQRGKDVHVNLRNARALLVSLCVIDEQGKRLFKDKKDIEALGTKSSKAIDAVFAKCQKMNGLTKKDVEDLTKNSEATESDDSTSD